MLGFQEKTPLSPTPGGSDLNGVFTLDVTFQSLKMAVMLHNFRIFRSHVSTSVLYDLIAPYFVNLTNVSKLPSVSVYLVPKDG